MKLEVISISNKLTKWEDETLKFYLKQISSFANITIQNIKPAQGRNLSIREVQINEEKDILKRIKSNSLIFLGTSFVKPKHIIAHISFLYFTPKIFRP